MSEVFSFPAGKVHLHGDLRRDRQDHLQQARPAAHGVNAAAEVGNHGRGATVLVDSQSIVKTIFKSTMSCIKWD